jgi:hypothetical protein
MLCLWHGCSCALPPESLSQEEVENVHSTLSLLSASHLLGMTSGGICSAPRQDTKFWEAIYSDLKARIGSIEAARRAGTNPATAAHMASAMAAPTYANGSLPFTS